ncbi:MAG: hypothetical protein ACOYOV_15265 [Bacteroidales bacterium]
MRKFALLIFCTIQLFIACKRTELKALPQKNLKDFRSSSCLIFVDINHDKKVFTILIENDLFYDLITKQYHWGKIKYISRLNDIITKKISPLDVNDDLYSDLKNFVLNTEYCTKYDTIDILNDTSLIINNKISSSLTDADINAIVYTLLKKNLRNCCVDDESGVVYLAQP